MDTVERIARDLAAVLSPEGEHAWPEFVPLAVEVKARLDHQLDDLLVADENRKVSADTVDLPRAVRGPARRN